MAVLGALIIVAVATIKTGLYGWLAAREAGTD
jgi:hypothetical protein